MRAFVINLAHRSDRLVAFKNEFWSMYFDTEVVSAVDGRHVVPDPKRVNEWNFRFLHPEKCKRVVACCLSHLGVWEKIVKEFENGKIDNNTPVVVFEDDVTTLVDKSEFKTVWGDLLIQLEKTPKDFLWLNSPELHPYKFPKGVYSRHVIIKESSSQVYTTEAYMVKPSYAKILVETIQNDIGAVDAHMARVLASTGNNQGLSFPLFCQRDRNDTDIQIR